MRALRAWAIYLLALAVAAGLALAAGTGESVRSPVASVENTSGAGLRALYLYLRESGLDVDAHRTDLTELPSEVRTVVIPAPTARRISEDEVRALAEFAQSGGTVVVLAAANVNETQPALTQWLELSRWTGSGEASSEPTSAQDPFGATARVEVREGVLAGVETLRVGRDRAAVEVGRRPAIPVASHAGAPVIWWLPLEDGEIVVAPPDIAENRRIDLEGNLALWSALASRGPLRFDEFHHAAEGGPPMSRGLMAFSLQLLAFFAFFAFARGARLGPPRPERVERHRSTREYLEAFAWLTRRAKVERALLRELHQRFRILLHDRLGVPTTQAEEEAARELERQCGVSGEAYLELVRELRACIEAGAVSPKRYAQLSRRLARLERVVRGLSPR